MTTTQPTQFLSENDNLMKMRHGFVSNSSSSSFVVLYIHRLLQPGDPAEVKLTLAQLSNLRNTGFYYTASGDTVCNPEPKDLEMFAPYENVFLRYDITCNQEDVILDLLENKIPFIASVHYDERVVSWDGKAEYFIERPNHVSLLKRHLHSTGEVSMCDTCKVKRINVSDFIARELKYKLE